MDPLSILLSRIQMGFTLGMHIIFPVLNIGLALFICIMEGMWLKTKNIDYLHIAKFWTKLFAIPFGVGVVSGIVMSYELGTNFGNFTNAIGEVLGSLFTYEVLTAFFLEAGFLGIMLFGWQRVSPKMHFFATLMVMIGTFVSAFWIMSANSWMQTPAGYTFVDGKFMVDSWLQVLFNPSFMHRFIHMVLATYLTASFFIAAVSAYYLLKKRHIRMSQIALSFAMWMALILTPIQFMVGDAVGLIVHQYQPLKTAAIEGVWDTQQGAPLVLFGIPNSAQEKNLFTIQIPYGASLINTHQLNGTLIGLKTVPPEDRPVVMPTFFGFRIMVGIAVLFLAAALVGLYLRLRKKLYTTAWFHKILIGMGPFGMIATIAGWMTAESGRQPWAVYGLMRTAAGASPVPASHVAITLTAIIIVYLAVLISCLYYLFKFIRKGPESTEKEQEPELASAFTYMGNS